MIMSFEDHVDIVNDDDVIAARRKGRMLAVELGFPPGEQAMLAAVITELACNIVNHAEWGEISVQTIEEFGRRGVEVIARDYGPGIPNVKEALHASHSVTASLGLGLRGVKGITDSLEILSVPGKGTTVTARKWRS